MADQPPPPLTPQGLPAALQANANDLIPDPHMGGGPAMQPLIPARRPSTFLELFQDVQRDPCQGRYQAIMARFNPEVQGPVNVNTLTEQAVGTPAHVPQAYLCCVLSRRGIRIHCIHMPSRFVGSLDGRVTPWDGSSFAFLGDVVHGLATTVVFPPNAFNVTGNVRVLPCERLLETYRQDPLQQDPLPPVTADELEGQLAYTRMIMYLPTRYAPYFLDANGYTIRQTWDTLLPLLQANDDLEHCSPLLDWLRIASYYQPPNNGQANLAPPAVAINLVTPIADATLLEHRATALALALPRQLLDACARQPDAFSTMSPVVTPKLLQDLRTFTFLADSQDDLKTGLQPFIIADGSEEHRRANLELACQYGLLQEGTAGVMLADLQALEAKEAKSIPLTYYDLEKTLGMFGNLTRVVLGNNHPITTHYRVFWDQLTKSMRNELQLMIDTTGKIKPAHILRSLQLVCHRWFAHKRARLQPKDPDFADILDRIALQAYVLPHLPTALFRLAYPMPTTTRSAIPGASLSVITPSISSGEQSVVSALTQATRQTTGSARSGVGGRGSFQANLTPAATLLQLVPGNVRLRDLMTNATAPTMEDDTPICLSYHLRSGCWSNCARLASHKVLSAAEKQRLANFALAQVPKVQVASGASHPVP